MSNLRQGINKKPVEKRYLLLDSFEIGHTVVTDSILGDFWSQGLRTVQMSEISNDGAPDKNRTCDLDSGGPRDIHFTTGAFWYFVKKRNHTRYSQSRLQSH